MPQRNLFLMPLVILITGLFLSTNLQSDEPPAVAGPLLPPIATDVPAPAGKTSPEDKIRQALAKPIELNFKETPLAEVVKTLRDKLHINILLDKRTLAEAGVAEDTPVTFSISNISAKSALALMLRDLGDLTAVIQHELLMITTVDEANSILEIRVYDVTDLVYGTESKDEKPDFQSLIDVIAACVRPTSWDSVGGLGSISPFDAVGIKALVLSTSQDIHEEVADLIAQLRAVRRGANIKGKVGAATAAAVPQSAVSSAKRSPFTPQEEKIRRALSLPLPLQFQETPLKKIAEYIHNKSNIQVLINNKYLHNVDTPFTVDLVGLDLSDALDSMLREQELGWTIYKEMLLITSPGEANDLKETKTYDVSDLPAFRNKHGQPVPDYDNLIEAITSAILPSTWDSVGGPGTIKPYENKWHSGAGC